MGRWKTQNLTLTLQAAPAVLPAERRRAAAAQVAFPLVLDVYEFCSAELKKELEGPREAARAAADRAAGLEKAAKVARRTAYQHPLTPNPRQRLPGGAAATVALLPAMRQSGKHRVEMALWHPAHDTVPWPPHGAGVDPVWRRPVPGV